METDADKLPSPPFVRKYGGVELQPASSLQAAETEVGPPISDAFLPETAKPGKMKRGRKRMSATNRSKVSLLDGFFEAEDAEEGTSRFEPDKQGDEPVKDVAELPKKNFQSSDFSDAGQTQTTCSTTPDDDLQAGLTSKTQLNEEQILLNMNKSKNLERGIAQCYDSSDGGAPVLLCEQKWPSGQAVVLQRQAEDEIAKSLEFLRQWTVGQDEISRQILEQQGRLETRLKEISDSSLLSSKHQSRLDSMIKSMSLASGSRGFVNEGSENTLFSEVSFAYPEERIQSHPVGLAGPAIKEEEENLDKQSHSKFDHQSTLAMMVETRTDMCDRGTLGPVTSRLLDALPSFPRGKSSQHANLNFLTSIVESHKYEYCAACLILAHSIFIGVYVEYLATVSDEVPTAFKITNVVLTALFILECALKVVGEGKAFWIGKECAWNLFDCILLSLVIVEVITSAALAGKDAQAKKKMKTVLKIAEMARTSRVLRIFRFLHFSQTLTVILHKVFFSIRAFGWVLVLIAMMIFVVAVCMTQAYNDYLLGEQHDMPISDMSSNKRAMDDLFGSIPRSAYTLLACISGGLEWSSAFDVLSKGSPFYASIFLFFIVISVFAMVNILNGIFVNDAIKAESDIFLDLDAASRLEQVSKLRMMFERMDLENADRVTLDEFLRFTKDPALEQYLEKIDVKPAEAEALFHLLDQNGEGIINVQDFLDRCMHLRGEATSLDMKTVLYECRKLRHKMFKHILWSEDMMSHILKKQYVRQGKGAPQGLGRLGMSSLEVRPFNSAPTETSVKE